MLEMDALLQRASGPTAGGQRQRVAIGRAIVKRAARRFSSTSRSPISTPRCARARGSSWRGCTSACDTTMVFVTHDQVEAMTMATRIVVMNQGRIEQVGTPMGVYQRPATRFVAGFIGSPAMNFLQGRAAGVQSGVPSPCGLPDGTGHPDRVPGAGHGGGPVELGVRAETCRDRRRAPCPPSSTSWSAWATARSSMSRLRDGTAVVYEDEGDSAVGVGDPIALAFRQQFVHLFDAAGKALPFARAGRRPPVTESPPRPSR